RIVIAARDPVSSAQVLGKMFAPESLRKDSDGAWTLTAGSTEIELIQHTDLIAQFGDAVPDPAGRQGYMAWLSARTASISQVTRALDAGRIRYMRVQDRRIRIPATQAMNCVLEFVEN